MRERDREREKERESVKVLLEELKVCGIAAL
jgi:hypothetical protein